MVGNWPHSSPTRSTSVTNILILTQDLIFSNCMHPSIILLQLYTDIVFSNDNILPVWATFLSNLFNFSTNVGNFPSVWQHGGASRDELSNVGAEGLVRRRGGRDDL